jgi:SAM-dependent methyltransferase
VIDASLPFNSVYLAASSLMHLDPTQRFSSRVKDYLRYRPSYPTGITDLLARECGLTKHSRIADVGSGTGLLASLFLDFGCEVTGVEPNSEMRIAGERMLADRPRFHSVDGRAEATTLPDSSVDFVTAATAFHWFEPWQARAEFRRILRPAGSVVLVSNERLPVPGFMAGYEDLVARYAPECPRVEPYELDRFFGHTSWHLTKLANQQQLDLEGLRGRFRSSSRAPLPGMSDYEPLMEELRRLFEEHQKEGRVRLLYETEIYFGTLQE